MPVVNLGFAGSGRMEMEMVEHLARIDASCYVLDCLWNMDKPKDVPGAAFHDMYAAGFDENDRIDEYDKWMHGDDLIKTPSVQLVPIGIGGVLYPPKTMNEKMFDVKSIKELCLKADDLWLKCSSCSVGTKVFAVCNASKYLYELEEAQNTALKKGNVNLKQNDLYFKKAFDFFELEEKDFRE